VQSNSKLGNSGVTLFHTQLVRAQTTGCLFTLVVCQSYFEGYLESVALGWRQLLREFIPHFNLDRLLVILR